MHLSINDITEVSAKASPNQQSYTLFNISINGFHHCSCRYSQLYQFHEELQRSYSDLPPFPPKKLFSLSAKDTEERRIGLERYLQSIIQNKSIGNSPLFVEFFLRAQRETFANDSTEKINLTIRLLNNHEIILENLPAGDSTSRFYEACARKIQLNDEFDPYFALFLYDQQENQLNLLRSFYDFESPYFSLIQSKKIYPNACVVLKKSYWDPEFDLALLDDRRTRNLLFVQAQHEIEQSEKFSSSNEIHQQLNLLQDKSSLKDYVLLARTSPFYGHVLVRNCSILSPVFDKNQQRLSTCSLAIGNNELICCFPSNESKKKSSSNEKQFVFKVTRIRCWKANWADQEANIAIEYLVKKDHLEWVEIYTKQSILVSLCLQSMVDEILARKSGATSPKSIAVVAPPTPSASQSTSNKQNNSLNTRTESDLERLNNNDLFDRVNVDDDL